MLQAKVNSPHRNNSRKVEEEAHGWGNYTTYKILGRVWRFLIKKKKDHVTKIRITPDLKDMSGPLLHINMLLSVNKCVFCGLREKVFHCFLECTLKCWVVLTQFWVKYGQTQPLGYIFK